MSCLAVTALLRRVGEITGNIGIRAGFRICQSREKGKEITGHLDNAEQLGLTLAKQLLDEGAKEILAEVYK